MHTASTTVGPTGTAFAHVPAGNVPGPLRRRRVDPLPRRRDLPNRSCRAPSPSPSHRHPQCHHPDQAAQPDRCSPSSAPPTPSAPSRPRHTRRSDTAGTAGTTGEHVFEANVTCRVATVAAGPRRPPRRHQRAPPQPGTTPDQRRRHRHRLTLHIGTPTAKRCSRSGRYRSPSTSAPSPHHACTPPRPPSDPPAPPSAHVAAGPTSRVHFAVDAVGTPAPTATDRSPTQTCQQRRRHRHIDVTVPSPRSAGTTIGDPRRRPHRHRRRRHDPSHTRRIRHRRHAPAPPANTASTATSPATSPPSPPEPPAPTAATKCPTATRHHPGPPSPSPSPSDPAHRPTRRRNAVVNPVGLGRPSTRRRHHTTQYTPPRPPSDPPAPPSHTSPPATSASTSPSSPSDPLPRRRNGSTQPNLQHRRRHRHRRQPATADQPANHVR